MDSLDYPNKLTSSCRNWTFGKEFYPRWNFIDSIFEPYLFAWYWVLCKKKKKKGKRNLYRLYQLNLWNHGERLTVVDRSIEKWFGQFFQFLRSRQRNNVSRRLPLKRREISNSLHSLSFHSPSPSTPSKSLLPRSSTDVTSFSKNIGGK